MGIIKDEASDLLPLYDVQDISVIAFRTIIEDHLARFGRIGFLKDNDEALTRVGAYFTSERRRDELQREKTFVTALLKTDLEATILGGFARGKSTVPAIDYVDPTAVLFLDGTGTDAAVIGDNEFGINCAELWLPELQHLAPEEAVKQALPELECISVHESNHLFLDQARGEASHPFYKDLFHEGLAVFSEPRHGRRHHEYLAELEFWQGIIRQVTGKISPAERREMYTKIAENPTLKKHRPLLIPRIKAASETNLDRTESRWLDGEILLNANGPIYHVGYAMWKAISDAHGIEKVRELAAAGPAKFMQAYQALAQPK
jgi:hypothetical protein